MTRSLTAAALTLAMTGSLALATPETAAAHGWHPDAAKQGESWHHGRRHRDRYDRYYEGGSYTSYRGDYDDSYEVRRRYDEPVYRSTRVWRGDDGRTYCRRRDGTTGLLIGGAAGALLGREVAGRHGDQTLGAVLGAAAGALIGREIDRGGSRCR
jgi:hypothetical protein